MRRVYDNRCQILKCTLNGALFFTIYFFEQFVIKETYTILIIHYIYDNPGENDNIDIET